MSWAVCWCGNPVNTDDDPACFVEVCGETRIYCEGCREEREAEAFASDLEELGRECA